MAEEKIIAAPEAAEKKAPAKKTAAKKAPAKKAPAKKAPAEKAPAAKAAAEKAPAKKAPAKAKASASVTIKLVKSLIGRSEKQIATAKSLGLKRVGNTTVQPDNAATTGKINTISHMVEVTKA